MENDLSNVAVKEKIHEFYSILESLETMMKAVVQEQEMLTNALIQQTEAIRTLRSLDEVDGTVKDMIIPIGGSAFFKGNVEVSSNAMVRIGSDLIVEKPIPEVIKTIEGRVRELEVAINEHEEKRTSLKEKEQRTLTQIQDLKSLLEPGKNV